MSKCLLSDGRVGGTNCAFVYTTKDATLPSRATPGTKMNDRLIHLSVRRRRLFARRVYPQLLPEPRRANMPSPTASNMFPWSLARHLAVWRRYALSSG